MGFSVSGSFAVVAVAVFVAVSALYTASFDGFEQVTDAQEETFDDRLDEKNTEIEIQRAEWRNDGDATPGNEYLAINVTNNGTTVLSVNDTDVVVDNDYQTTFTRRDVDGDTGTELWAPGETLNIRINDEDLAAGVPPERVRVTTEHGVAAATGVT